MGNPHIIKQLGGASSVGETLRGRGVQVQDVTVRSWTLPGRVIPAKYWVHVAAIAKDKGIQLSFEEMAEQAAAQTRPAEPEPSPPFLNPPVGTVQRHPGPTDAKSPSSQMIRSAPSGASRSGSSKKSNPCATCDALDAA